jgi:hypothetical protein
MPVWIYLSTLEEEGVFLWTNDLSGIVPIAYQAKLFLFLGSVEFLCLGLLVVRTAVSVRPNRHVVIQL